ncbi:MAG: cobalamin-dependent protein [Coriobacteriia bacterium]
MSDAVARLYQAFVSQDPAGAIAVVEEAKGAGAQRGALFDDLYAPSLAMLGGAWASRALDEVAFAQASVVAEQIGPFVVPPAAAPDTGITIVVGCAASDRHDIRKNVIAAALKEAGHRVVDLGADARPTEFVEKVAQTGARIAIVCAELTGTVASVRRVRELLAADGRDDVVVLAAGGPFDADGKIARELGANGVVLGAESALRLVARIASDLFAPRPDEDA